MELFSLQTNSHFKTLDQCISPIFRRHQSKPVACRYYSPVALIYCNPWEGCDGVPATSNLSLRPNVSLPRHGARSNQNHWYVLLNDLSLGLTPMIQG